MLLLACQQAHLYGFICMASILAAKPIERAMGPEKISLGRFDGLRWRLYRQDTQSSQSVVLQVATLYPKH